MSDLTGPNSYSDTIPRFIDTVLKRNLQVGHTTHRKAVSSILQWYLYLS